MRLGNEILCGYLQYWNSVGHVATTEHSWQFISRAQHEKSSRRLRGQGSSLDHKWMSVFHSNILSIVRFIPLYQTALSLR